MSDKTKPKYDSCEDTSLFALRRYFGLWLVACSLFILVAALPLPAQEQRWKELNAQVKQLYQQGKYAEAIPPAQESLRVAEATFGPRNVAIRRDARTLVAVS
jgi:hypothetical protein